MGGSAARSERGPGFTDSAHLRVCKSGAGLQPQQHPLHSSTGWDRASQILALSAACQERDAVRTGFLTLAKAARLARAQGFLSVLREKGILLTCTLLGPRFISFWNGCGRSWNCCRKACISANCPGGPAQKPGNRGDTALCH